MQTVTYVTKDGTIKTHTPVGLRMSLADVRRLADKAEREGVQVFTDLDHQQFIATSGTFPTERYYHTDYSSCTCPGYRFVGRCKHIAKLHREAQARAWV